MEQPVDNRASQRVSANMLQRLPRTLERIQRNTPLGTIDQPTKYAHHMLSAPDAHKLACGMVDVRDSAGIIRINISNGIETQAYGVLCEAISVKPQEIRRQANRECTPCMKEPFELFVKAGWRGCFPLGGSAVARF
jgi:hypothetical protein